MKPKNKPELIKMIKQAIKEQGLEANLNHIDVSAIDEMIDLFSFHFELEKFNGDISQ